MLHNTERPLGGGGLILSHISDVTKDTAGGRGWSGRGEKDWEMGVSIPEVGGKGSGQQWRQCVTQFSVQSPGRRRAGLTSTLQLIHPHEPAKQSSREAMPLRTYPCELFKVPRVPKHSHLVLTTSPGGRQDNPRFADEGTPCRESQLSSQLRAPGLPVLSSSPSGLSYRKGRESDGGHGEQERVPGPHKGQTPPLPPPGGVWLQVLRCGQYNLSASSESPYRTPTPTPRLLSSTQNCRAPTCYPHPPLQRGRL